MKKDKIYDALEKALPDWTMQIVDKVLPPNLESFVQQRLEEIGEDSLSETEKKLFEIPEPGPRKRPVIEHSKALHRLFSFLGQTRAVSWSQLSSTKKKVAKEHALIELSSLRSEIVDLKSQITSSERLMATWMVGAVFAYSKDIIPTVWILLVPFLLSLFGFVRFREFQRNVFNLDCYLRELEHAVRPDAGWVTFFFSTRRMEQFFETRLYFWIAAIGASSIVLILGLSGVISPQPINIAIQP